MRQQIGSLEFGGEDTLHSRVDEINTLTGALGSARRAIGTFALYVPRELVRKIVASGQAVAGSAHRQEVTVLFTDIQDFTTISESRSPEEIVALLTAYFELMNEIVEQHHGVIVQYLGDSIYAMWNAPEPDTDHVRQWLPLHPGVEGGYRRAERKQSCAAGCRSWSRGSDCIPAPRWSAASGPARAGSIRRWGTR